MISRVKGIVASRSDGRVEIECASGVSYEIEVPLMVLERVPSVGLPFELRTLHIVREDSTALYGFNAAHERDLFKRLLGAKGVGPKVALAMMSTLRPERLARALVEKDLAALSQVPGVGRKTAERIAVELGDRVTHLVTSEESGPGTDRVHAAVKALIALGLSFNEADTSVRRVIEQGAPEDTEELIRQALAPAPRPAQAP